MNMTSYRLNHVNIRTEDLEETRDFYVNVIGLEEGFRPPFPNPGYWMYAGDMPVVHISPCDTESAARTNPAGMGAGLDHFALWGAGLEAQLATLELHGVSFTKRLAGGGAVIQVFFEDPNGVQIELGYDPAVEGVTSETFDGEILGP